MAKLVPVLILASVCGCRDSALEEGVLPVVNPTNIASRPTHPTEKEVVDRAKEFVRCYVEDSGSFFKEVDNLMGDQIEAEFELVSGRWYVFFTNGFHHIHVFLDRDANLGTLQMSNGKIITRRPDSGVAAYSQSPPPLFSLSEFKEVARLPHNK